MRRFILLFACCVCLAACREPATAVMVVVTADPNVMNEAVRLRYVVEGGPGTNMLGGPIDADTPTPGPGSWPVIIPIVPRDNDASRAFRVTVHAIGASGDLVIARGISGFTRGEVRAMRLHLSDACRVPASNCPMTETCEGGVCQDAFTPPNELPPYMQMPPPPPDGGPNDGGGLPTCGNNRLDPSEQCDDGNTFPGDGCEPGSCQFSCTDPSVCDDFNDCTDNLCEQVNVGGSVGQACNFNAGPDGLGCEIDGSAGTCFSGECLAAGCGDGFWESGELCYDASGLRDQGIITPDPSTVIAAGDFDGNGRWDLLLGGDSSGNVWAAENVSASPLEFSLRFSFSPGPQFFGAGDPDRNGIASMYAPNWNGCASCFARVDVDFGSFVFRENGVVPIDGPLNAAGVGDINGDGIDDFLVVHRSPVFPTPSNFGAAILQVDASGGLNFQTDEMFDSPNPSPVFSVEAGFPGAGNPHSVWVYRADGMVERYAYDGVALSPVLNQRSIPGDPFRPVHMLLEPLNATDSFKMLFFTSNDPTVGLATRIHDPGSLNEMIRYDWGTGDHALFVAIRDLDNDGDSDGVVVTPTDVRFMITDASSFSFSAGPTIALACTPATSATGGDFNGDGAPDLAIATPCGVTTLLARP